MSVLFLHGRIAIQLKTFREHTRASARANADLQVAALQFEAMQRHFMPFLDPDA
jgi:hypothetical protein